MTEESDYRSRRITGQRVSVDDRIIYRGLTNICFNVPVNKLKQIDAHIVIGNYLNRSEFIRHAITEQLNKELMLQEKKSELEKYYDSKLIKEKMIKIND